MKLPDVFQMRVDTLPGYTHVVERLPSGSYEVKWARGWSKVRDIEWYICTEKEAHEFVAGGGWIVVEDKKVEQGLPDEFDFYSINPDTIYTAVRDEAVWKVWKKGLVGQNEGGGATYGEKQIKQLLEGGYYNILKRVKITPEQLRSNAEVQEQISALEHNVKLRKQDVEHAEILIANYEARIKDLQNKLVKES